MPTDEQRRRIERICRGDAWILDSIYSTWLDLVLARAQVIVALDYPRWLSYGRLLRRTAARMITREPVCNGNVELLRNVLARDSILWFHFRSFGRNAGRSVSGRTTRRRRRCNGSPAHGSGHSCSPGPLLQRDTDLELLGAPLDEYRSNCWTTTPEVAQ